MSRRGMHVLDDGPDIAPGGQRVLAAEDRAERRRDADRRRAADAKRLDRFPDRRHVAAIEVDELGGKPRLVDHADEARRRITHPAHGFQCFD